MQKIKLILIKTSKVTIQWVIYHYKIERNKEANKRAKGTAIKGSKIHKQSFLVYINWLITEVKKSEI